MKTMMFMFLFIGIALNCYSQSDTTQNWPGEKPNLLLGKKIMVLPLDNLSNEQWYTSESFSDDSEYKDYSNLKNKIFDVLDCEPYKDIIGQDKFKLKIENQEIGILYFDYDPRFEFSFPFKVLGGLAVPVNFDWGDITTSTDKFTGDISYESPGEEGIYFLKVKKRDQTVIYLHVQNSCSIANAGISGVIFLLS